jgi:carboxyl-terminal processing protease
VPPPADAADAADAAEEMKPQLGRRAVWLVLVACLAALVLRNAGEGGLARAEDQDLVRTLLDVQDRIEAGYVRELDRADLARAAVDGMLGLTTDVNTVFVPPVQTQSFEDDLAGRFTGVGILIRAVRSQEPDWTPDQPTGGLVVTRPLPGGPAKEAGILPRDRIVAVNGASIIDQPQREVIDQIRGIAGTDVTLTIDRGDDEQLDFRLTRRPVRAILVDGFSVDDEGEPQFLIEYDLPQVGTGEMPRVAFVRLPGFVPGSTEAVAGALMSVDVGRLDGIVLDLRGNPGGQLSEAVALADLFLPGGRIVSEEGANLPRRDFYATPAADATGQRVEELPLVVVVDGGSASASEVFAAAIQEHGRGTVVGTRTYGKGSVQTIDDLGRGGRLGRLKYTTAYYLTPAGRPVDRSAGEAYGVYPQVTVELEADAPEGFGDAVPAPGQVWTAYQVLVAKLAALAGGEGAAEQAPLVTPARSPPDAG